jgi:hypothetical protein
MGLVDRVKAVMISFSDRLDVRLKRKQEKQAEKEKESESEEDE